MRKLATIRKIKDIRPIPDADAIELAQIDGWQVVIGKKENFKVDDLVIYCEIDSILPELEPFEFLRNKKFRIKTMKLRGALSQGIVFPLSILNSVLPEGHSYNEFDNVHRIFVRDGSLYHIEEGLDLTELIGVEKYEPPIPAQLSGEVKGNFPHQVQKSDEERCQNLVEDLNKLDKAMKFVITEKLDGTSCTFALIDNEFHVCSRNLDLKETEGNTYWKIAREQNIEEKMEKYLYALGPYRIKNFAIQGELIGEGIQKNKYKLKGQDFYIFNIFDIDNQQYFDDYKFNDFIDFTDLKAVPKVDEVSMEDFSDGDLIDNLLKYAEGKSKLNPDTEREGVVFKSKENQNIFGLSKFKKISFKAISNKFLLKNED